MLGDFVGHANGAEEFYAGFLDAAVELYAKQKPLVFVRGNHEQIGLFTADYSLVGHFSGRTWYCFRQGKVCFAVLDGGNDHPDEPGQGIHRNRAMVQEECRWVEEMARSEVWKDAAFRVVLIHMPPCSDDYDSKMALQLVHAIPAEVPLPDLLLGGHVHRYFRMMPGEAPYMPLGPHHQVKNWPSLPYPVISNDIHTGLFVDVKADSIIVTVRKTDGSVVDSFQIARKS